MDSNARLKVRFFGPIDGDYWIIKLGDDYEYVVVGEPRRAFLWILSRTPIMNASVYEDILSRLPEKGYNPDRLELVLQAAE